MSSPKRQDPKGKLCKTGSSFSHRRLSIRHRTKTENGGAEKSAKRLKERYETETDDKEWLSVSPDGIPPPPYEI